MRMLRISLSTLILSLGIGSATSMISGCKTTNSGLSDAEQQNNNPAVQRDLAASGPRLRMSVFDPNNKANVDAYAKAFHTMQATPEGRKIWEQLASTHQNFCPHGNWFFLPWHRVYLHHFERTIAEISGKADFALPYWDWDGQDRNRMPPATLEKTSLFWAKRAPLAADDQGKLNPNNVGAPAMSRIMGANNFISFGSGRSRALRRPRSPPWRQRRFSRGRRPRPAVQAGSVGRPDRVRASGAREGLEHEFFVTRRQVVTPLRLGHDLAIGLEPWGEKHAFSHDVGRRGGGRVDGISGDGRGWPVRAATDPHHRGRGGGTLPCRLDGTAAA